jgi:Fic family protein
MCSVKKDVMPEPKTNCEPMEAARKAYHDAVHRDYRPFQLADAFPMPADLHAFYAQLTALKGYLDEFRPFDPHQVEKLREVFDTEYTYHSNKIEGNTLTLRETDLVVNKGITIGGKSVREHFEAVNHAEAIKRVRELAGGDRDITEPVVLELHALVLQGIDRPYAGRYRDERVRISGSQHVPPNYVKVPDLMTQMYAWYDSSKATLHPVQLAAEMHEKLATIHPFRDGNGRTSRLLMNLILLRNGFPVTVISGERDDRLRYYETLEAAQISQPVDNMAFQRFVAQNVHHWLIRYLEMVTVNGTDRNNGKGAAFLRAIEPHLSIKPA